MKKIAYLLLTISFCGLTACKTGTKKGGNMDNETLVKIETTLGDIKVKLYNETPKHRDNFIKLAEEGVYEGTLFHRVIKDFMIQAGDPDSKNAPKGKMLGAGDVGYTLPAEFVYPKYFHKKGALSAARQGDNVNPKKESSGCQFYIVTGKVYNDSTLLGMESQMNENKINVIFNTLAQKHMKEIYKMRKENDENGLYELQEKLFAQAQEEAAKQPEFHFTPEQVEAYTTVGGTPHLDGEYTVFGEVVEGMDIVDKIQQAYGVFDGIVINPAAYTHTSVAILDALKAVALPAVEVHLSDVDAREAFRHVSYAGMACFARFTGLGFEGYRQAILFLKDYLHTHTV